MGEENECARYGGGASLGRVSIEAEGLRCCSAARRSHPAYAKPSMLPRQNGQWGLAAADAVLVDARKTRR